MNELRCILATTDFSPASSAALEVAARWASGTGAELVVLHVLEEEFVRQWKDWQGQDFDNLHELKRIARARMKEVMERPGLASLAWKPVVTEGHPFVKLAEELKISKAQLLVMGTQGVASRGTSRATGSLASKATRKLPAKVLLVPAGQGGPIARVIAAIDFSETSEAVLREAIRVARMESAELEVLHVLYPPERDYYFGAMVGITEKVAGITDEVSQLQETTARNRLEKMIMRFQEDLGETPVRIRLPRSPHPGHWLVAELSGAHSTLVVLGTRGRTDFEGFFIGTAAERVVAECPCCVLTVKPPGFRSPLA